MALSTLSPKLEDLKIKPRKIVGDASFRSFYRFNKKGKKFIAFSQKMFMYKLNLQNINESNWIGSKITKKKYNKLKSIIIHIITKIIPLFLTLSMIILKMKY